MFKPGESLPLYRPERGSLKIFRASQPIAGAGSEIRRRLFCLPYAGSSAAIFRGWADFLPPDIELCVPVLPGRDARVDEAPIVEMSPLVHWLMERIGPRLTLPYAIFGHSMGAFIAFDLAHEIARRGLRQPSHLFISAQRGPSLPYLDRPIFRLPDEQFLAAVMTRYKRIPKALMEQEDFKRVFLRVLRSDFTLVEDYQYRASAKLVCPITAFGGLSDRQITRAQLEAWSVETADRFALHLVPGEHFFIESARDELLALIGDEMGV